MKILAFGTVLLCFTTAASADILVWQDDNGVSHYTNLKAEVPKERQQTAQVIVDEALRPATQTPAVEQPPASQPAEPRREAQVVYDRTQLSTAYLEGLQRGLELGQTINAGGNVQISGPLAVSNATSLPPYYGSRAYPLVTTSFDRGRSRHLTLRMLLEDQFAIDQEGPYVYQERFLPPFGHPPQGVALNPFLPRGLPHGFPQDLRVVTW